MIDFNTYAELHRNNPYSLLASTTRANLLVGDEQPKTPEIYLFPSRVPGFDLRYKKWGEYLFSEGSSPFPH